MAKKSYPAPYRWKPKNVDKYSGDPNNIWIRSSWEKRFFLWCDRSSNIVKYSSEETVIPYICPTDSKPHRYFVDAKIYVKTKDNKVKTYLVEIKPLVQTQKPKYPGRQTKRYLTEAATFMKNQAKWEAATRYCKQRGYTFIILTEKELGIK